MHHNHANRYNHYENLLLPTQANEVCNSMNLLRPPVASGGILVRPKLRESGSLFVRWRRFITLSSGSGGL